MCSSPARADLTRPGMACASTRRPFTTCAVAISPTLAFTTPTGPTSSAACARSRDARSATTASSRCAVVWIADGTLRHVPGQAAWRAQPPRGARRPAPSRRRDGNRRARPRSASAAGARRGGRPPHGTSSLHARSRALRLGMPLRGYERCRGEHASSSRRSCCATGRRCAAAPLSQLEGERDSVHASFDFEPYRKLVEMRESSDRCCRRAPLPIGFVDLSRCTRAHSSLLLTPT